MSLQTNKTMIHAMNNEYGTQVFSDDKE